MLFRSEHQFIIAKTLLESMEQFRDNDELVRSFCVGLRNPVIFDNQVSEAFYTLPYKMELDNQNSGPLTEDHLIGISNIVLYIFKNEIYKRWNNVEDFKKTLKTFQVLLTVPKSLNDKGSYKYGWQFDVDNINECIKWDVKLKNENIRPLIKQRLNESTNPIFKKLFSV
mgnify:CR=1 FL=1